MLIYTVSLLLLTTFCKPSIRLLTTTRRPLSSWNMVLSSSQERSHISAPISSVFWPIMFVVMEGLTSTISVLSLTILAPSGGAKLRHQGECANKQASKQMNTATQTGDGKHISEIWWLKHKESDFLFSCRQQKDHNNVVITMFIVLPKTDVQSAVFDLKKCICLKWWWKTFPPEMTAGLSVGGREGLALRSSKSRNLGVPPGKPRCWHESPRPFK